MCTPLRLLRAALAGGLTLAGTAGLAACGAATGPDGGTAGADSLTALPRALSTGEQLAISGGNQFAFRLLRTADVGSRDNVLLSPLSVSFALGLTMNGAAGGTLTEMQQTLGWGSASRADINMAYRDLMTLLPTLDRANVQVQVANGVWVRTPNQPDTGFVSEARRFFAAPVHSLPTPRAMYDSVNTWAARTTDGRIPRVLPGDPPQDLMMLLGNVVTFAGAWRDRFDPGNTRPRPFMLDNGGTVSVPMMSRQGAFRSAMLSGGAPGQPTVIAAELPYGNSAYSMLLLMPSSGGVSTLVQRLDTALYGQISRALLPSSGGEIALPTFSLMRSRDLSRALMSLGMPRAFGAGAEFPRLFPSVRTAIDFVQHAVAVRVDEQGTRAAGVTVVGITRVSLPAGFVFDRPFVFLIRERLSGTILFAGVVRDPRA